MLIKEVQLRNYPYKSRFRLSERLAKKYFERKGYEVFRGHAMLKNSINYAHYESVRKKYDKLEHILLQKLGLNLYLLREQLQKGIPDFFVYRKQDNDCFFAEIKLEHEQIKSHQLECMRLLESFGLKVVVIRIKSKLYRVEIDMNPDTKNKKIWVKQEKIRSKYRC